MSYEYEYIRPEPSILDLVDTDEALYQAVTDSDFYSLMNDTVTNIIDAQFDAKMDIADEYLDLSVDRHGNPAPF